MNKKDWIAQATDPLDYAVRKLGANVSLAELTAEAKAAMAAGLFPGQGLFSSQQEIDAAKRNGGGYKSYEELVKESSEFVRRAREVLGQGKTVQPEGTVGIYNPESKKWEGGMPEEEAKKSSPQSTIGVYHPENKTWVGGGSKTPKKPVNPLTRRVIKNLAKRENREG